MADINIDELNEAINNLNRTMQDLSSNLGSFGDATLKATKNTKSQSDEAGKATQALDGLGRTTKGLTEAELARIEAQKKIKESEMYLKEATDKAKQAVGAFAGALLENQVKLTNFSGTLSEVGDVASTLGKSFGGLGVVIGGIIKGITVLGEAQLKQTQSLLDAKEQMNKLGGAGSNTTESILKMAHEADLNSETLNRMIKPMQGLGSDIMILGNNAGAAQKEFAELIKATEEERKQMMRLGINQEEMMQGTADFLALQAASGRSIKNELSDRDKLRRASIDYQTNLLDLASLTGKDVATLKEKQKEARLDAQRQIKDMADQVKINDLMKAGRKDEALQIQKEMNARNAALDALVDAPEALRKGAKEMIITGTISGEASQQLARNNMQGPMAEFAKTIKEGGDVLSSANKLQDDYAEKQQDRLRTSERALLVSEQARKDFDFNNVEDNKKRSARMFTNLEEELQAQRSRRAEMQKAGKDTASDVAATAQEGVITSTKALDSLVAATNPLIGEFTILKGVTLGLTAAAGAAALALAGISAKNKISSMTGGDGIKGLLGNLLGNKTAPTTGGVVPGVPIAGIPAAGGAGAANAGGVVEGLGKGNMLENAAKGLAAFANPKVALGAAGFGAAIAAVGAGLAGATWIMGKALPSLAEGLGPFEKLDGDKLSKTGKGILALGGGLAVFGAGGAAAGIGGIIGGLTEGLTSFFGGQTPFQKIEEFSKLDIDADKVEKNANAFMAFNKAMALSGGASATSGLGNAMGSIGDAIGSFFGSKPPTDKLKEFGNIDLGGDTGLKRIKDNAEAFTIFSKAMSEYKGGANDSITASISESASRFFNIDPPINKMQEFAAIDLGTDGAKKVKENAQAFVYFSKAMAEYKGGASDSISSVIASTALGFMDANPPTAKFVEFGKLDVNPESVKKNSEAFVMFSNAMADFKGGGEFKNAIDSMVGGITKFFGGDDVMGKFVKFTKLDVDPDKATKLATAFARYAKGLQLASSPGGAPASGRGTSAPASATPASPAPSAAPASPAPSTAAPAAAKPSGGFMSRVASALGFGGKDSGDSSKTSSGGGSEQPPATASTSGGGGQMSDQDIKDMIREHEGVRNRPYKDSLGLWTVGVGHLIGDGKTLPPAWNREFSDSEINALFDKDYEKHKKQAQSNVPGFSKYDSMGQGALIDLTFNMGPGWPKKFPNTSKKLAAGDTEGAARNLEDSLWYTQVGRRAPKIVSMIENSKVQARDGGLAMGPQSGYPATLHGNEMIVPLDPNSILADLGKKSATEIQTQIEQKTSQIQSLDPEMFKELTSINQAMMDMLSNKLDNMISKLETSNSTQDRILRYSQA